MNAEDVRSMPCSVNPGKEPPVARTSDAVRSGVGGFPRKPGPGWKRAGLPDVSVWDHVSGVRVHTFGLCRLRSGEFVNGGNIYPAMKLLDRAIREQGGNRRRGAMVWALRLWAEQGADVIERESESGAGSQNDLAVTRGANVPPSPAKEKP